MTDRNNMPPQVLTSVPRFQPRRFPGTTQQTSAIPENSDIRRTVADLQRSVAELQARQILIDRSNTWPRLSEQDGYNTDVSVRKRHTTLVKFV